MAPFSFSRGVCTGQGSWEEPLSSLTGDCTSAVMGVGGALNNQGLSQRASTPDGPEATSVLEELALVCSLTGGPGAQLKFPVGRVRPPHRQRQETQSPASWEPQRASRTMKRAPSIFLERGVCDMNARI